MGRAEVLANHKHVARYALAASEYSDAAEKSRAAGMTDAHDLTLMAVGAAGVAVQAASQSADEGEPRNVVQRSIKLADEAVERVRWLLAGAESNEKLDSLRLRVNGFACVLELADHQLRAEPRRVH